MADILEKNVRLGKHAQHPALILVFNMSPIDQQDNPQDGLHNKLQNASQQAAKKRLKAIALGGILVVAGGGALAGLSLFVGGRQDAASSAAVVEEAPTEAEIMALREVFKAAVKAFEHDLEADVLSPSFGVWNAEAQHDIRTAKARAIDLFSGGDYAEAVREMDGASTKASQEISAMNAAFEEAMTAAQKAYEQDAFDQAKLHITKAVSLRPSATDAQTLAQKIDTLPQVLSLVKAVQDARIQNDVAGEIKNLRALVALDPNREGLKARLDDLIIQTMEQRFAGHIKNGLACVEKRDLACAQTQGAAAQKIFPNRSEAALLTTKIYALGQELKVERLLADADAAMNSDQWSQALGLLQNASTIDSGQKRIRDGLELAQKITALDAQMNRYLSASDRLSADNVAAGAHAVVSESVALSSISPALSRKAQKLKDVLAGYATKVSVLVRSDNLTEISVRGVGQVGRTKERAIELKPGTYTVEGIRPGYKATLKTLVVAVGAKDVSIEVVCDEQL